MTTFLTIMACIATFVVGLLLGRRSVRVRPLSAGPDPSRDRHDEAFEDSVIELDRELVVVSARGESILGHRMDSLVGRPFLEHVSRNDRGPVRATLHLALEARAGRDHHFEADWDRRDESGVGRLAAVVRHTARLESPLAVRLTDVTQHHAATKELEGRVEVLRAAAAAARESIEFNLGALEGLMDHSPWAVVITDLEGRFVLVNDEAADWLGARREDLIGRLESELHDAKTAERIRQSDERLLTDGLPQLSRNSIRRNGETIEYEVSKVLLRRHGKPVAIAGIAARTSAESRPSATELFPQEGAAVAQRAQLHEAHDRQRRAESEADLMARRFEELARSIPLALCIVDRRTGEIEYANARFAAHFGEQAAEFGARTDAILARVLMEDRPPLRRLLRSGEECGELEIRLQGDALTWLRARTIHTDTDDAERILLVAEDVTEGKRNEIREQTDEKLMSLMHLAGGVAHDFNNALSPIVTSTEVARTALSRGDGDAATASLADIADAGERASRLVEGLIELTLRPEEPHVGEVPLDDLFHAVSGMMSGKSHETCGLQSEKSGLAVRGDADMLRRALVHLCANATEACTGRESGTISLSARVAEDDPQSVDILVRDDGCGIPPSHIQRVFEPLFTTKGHRLGFGVGLTLVHDIVERLDGAIDVESDLGKNTIVRLRLPRAVGKSATPESSGTPSSNAESGGESILLVDDDPLVLRSTARSLECLGYEVTTASSGEEAIRCCEDIERDFDLILTDHGMDGMSGVDLCRHIAERWPDTRRLLATGLRGEHASSELSSAGISGVLLKPFRLDDLRLSVRNALGSESAEPQEM